MTIKLDYSLATAEERIKLVEQIINQASPAQLTTRYLDKLSDYIIFTNQVKKDKTILTKNRMATVDKRETSYEGMVAKLENGEDGLYNLMHEDKNCILSPKISITSADLAEIEPLRNLQIEIKKINTQCEKAKLDKEKTAYILKQTLIQMRRDQYIIRNSYKEPVQSANLIKSLAKLDLSENIYLNENEDVCSTGRINLFDPFHISILLCNYSGLKAETWDDFNSDMRWLLMDLENVATEVLTISHPMLYDLLIDKIDGKSNIYIQHHLESHYGIKHSVEYISALWRNKIPKLIAEQAQNDWLIYHYTFEVKGNWKTCSKCGEVKLAHNRFFSKNKTSKDGYYSVCKSCRNKK